MDAPSDAALPALTRPGLRSCQRDEATGELVCVKDIERRFVRGPRTRKCWRALGRRFRRALLA
jgi:hypothetical protein